MNLNFLFGLAKFSLQFYFEFSLLSLYSIIFKHQKIIQIYKTNKNVLKYF